VGKGKGTRVYRCVGESNEKVYAIKQFECDAAAGASSSRTSSPTKSSSSNRDATSSAAAGAAAAVAATHDGGVTEAELLLSMDHVHIVAIDGYMTSERHVYIVLQYYEHGSLFKLMKREAAPYPEVVARSFVYMVLCALQYIHERGIMHRDVKASNVLIDNAGVCKLADFGLARREELGVECQVVGTPYWMAPEVIGSQRVSRLSDIWSVGCMLIELLVTIPPYFNLGAMAALYRMVEDDSPPMPKVASPVAVRFLTECFVRDYNRRKSAAQLLRHEWLLYADCSPLPVDAVVEQMRLVQHPIADENYVVAPASAAAAALNTSTSEFLELAPIIGLEIVGLIVCCINT
jgi:serine/threonine protein kinase